MSERTRRVFKHGFTTVGNDFLRDNTLSLRARGLLVTLLSLPDNWQFSVTGMAAILPEGKDAIRTVVKELEEKGYIERKEQDREHGKFGGGIWYIRDYPEPSADSPLTGNPPTVKPTQLITNKENTKRVNTKEGNIYNRGTSEKPTLEDVRAYCEERMNNVDPEQFYDYYESNGWMVGRNKMKDWKAAVRTWERKEKAGGQKQLSSRDQAIQEAREWELEWRKKNGTPIF